MFENTQPPSQAQNPLNPVMPPPGMQPPPPADTPPQQSPVHSMPERFRSTGSAGKGPGGNRKLLVILLVVLGVAGLVVGGLYAINSMLLNDSNANNSNQVANENANENINENLNANENTNAEVNENANENVSVSTNDNDNLNDNSNSNVNTSTNTNVSTTPLPSSQDTDADGLTDVEEAVFTTDRNNPDSDSDTFIDGKQVRTDGQTVGEVYLGYNPKGAGTLEASDIVKRVENGTKTYSILVPKSWSVTADTQGGILVDPTSQTGEFFQVQTFENASRLSPKQWYLQNNPSASADSVGTIAVNGLEGVISEDGSTVYLFKDTAVYGIQYGTGSATELNYRTTFDMIVRNFKLVAAT